MSALENDRLQMRRITPTPQKLTEMRRDTAEILGRPLPPPATEIAAYEAAGLTPPTE